MIQALVFDVFGVLYPDTYNEFVAKHASLLSEAQQNEIRELHQQSNRGTIELRDAITVMAKLTGSDAATVHYELYEKEHLNTDLVELIKAYKSRYKISILSNVGDGFLENFLSEHDLAQYFDVITLSCTIGYVKPERQAYEIAARDVGVSIQQCLMIDDKQRNIEGAQATSMPGLLYQNFPQFQRELKALLAS